MSYCEVDSTCVSDISQYKPVPADSSPSLNETSLLDRWANDVKPSLECDSEPAESIGPSHEALPSEGTLRIDCHVTGVVDAGSGTLIVGRLGHCEAEAFVGTALVDGVVSGNIHASKLVALGSEARVIGDIEAPTILIRRGASFEGTCHMLRPTESSDDSDNEQPHSSTSFSYESERDDAALAAAG
ncbi:MAG TPA: polymer-forming cytoskeletal protein [Pyrinomonadaceae bacterium]|nr:polymer-forming cytoskeletal protein [Pyrinomonadaceae bacterium]